MNQSENEFVICNKMIQSENDFNFIKFVNLEGSIIGPKNGTQATLSYAQNQRFRSNQIAPHLFLFKNNNAAQHTEAFLQCFVRSSC